MKNGIGIVVLALASVYSVLAQGEVEFQNNSLTEISVNSLADPNTFTPIDGGAGAYYFALFNSTTATTVAGSGSGPVGGGFDEDYVFEDSNWTLDGYGVSADLAGKFAATTVDSAGYTQIPGEPYASQFVVLGWSVNIGSTIASVESYLAGTDAGVTFGCIGESEVSGSIGTGTAGSFDPPTTIFGETSPSFPGVELYSPPLSET